MADEPQQDSVVMAMAELGGAARAEAVEALRVTAKRETRLSRLASVAAPGFDLDYEADVTDAATEQNVSGVLSSGGIAVAADPIRLVGVAL